MKVNNRPLIEEAEGRDQDRRSSLLAAFYKQLGARRNRETWDLHVRELLTYVLVNDRDGRGVPMSHDDIANVLCCERSAARRIVKRAEEYGLLAIIEDRYRRGGQMPNRYSIDWEGVNAVRYGTHEAQYEPETPPEPEGEPGAPLAQPAAPMAHPYKDNTLVLPLSMNTAAAAQWAAAAIEEADWEEIVRRANQLRKQCPMLDREFALHVCIAGEHVERGKVGIWLTSLRRGSVENPQAYLSKAMRDELSKLGIDWSMVRKELPAANPTSHVDS